MTKPLFYPEHFTQNYWGLQGLIRDSEAPDAIAALAKSRVFKESESMPIRYFGRWEVIVITLTQPFYHLFSLFTSVMARLAFALVIPSAGRALTVFSKHLTRDWQQLCAQWESDSPLLAPSLNTHRLDTWDTYQWGEIPYSYVEDEMVKPLTSQSTEFLASVNDAMEDFYEALEQVRYDQSWVNWIWNRGRTVSNREKRRMTAQVLVALKQGRDNAITALEKTYSADDLVKPIQAFYARIREAENWVKQMPALSAYSENGCDRGACLWFIYLFLQTKQHFKEPARHLRAVSEQFSSGLPRQAAVLHALDNTDDLLQMSREEYEEWDLTLHELDHNCSSALEKIEDLPEGIYMVGTRDHALVLIKESGGEFLWDPAYGLYEMTPSQCLNWLKSHYYKEGDPSSVVHFRRYTPE